MTNTSDAEVHLPRVKIQFCTQCKWDLRAAYFAQELLSTFSTAIGEVALVPATSGVFLVQIQYRIVSGSGTDHAGEVEVKTLWDRKTEGGFPETKELKKRVRDCIQPGRNLGHVDGNKSVKTVRGENLGSEKRGHERNEDLNDTVGSVTETKQSEPKAEGPACEDCACG